MNQLMSPREERLLRELVQNKRVFIRDLRERIGAQNPAEIKSQLVKRGWIIQTEFIAMLDRDGKRCYAGYYLIESVEQERGRQFLEEINRAEATALQVDDVPELVNSKTVENKNSKRGAI